MTIDFLPSEIQQLTEPDSIAFIKCVESYELSTSLSQQPIGTTYIHQGEGKPSILLLHGFDSSLLEFRRLVPLLATQHATWAVDLLGFGFTARCPDVAFNPATIKTHLYHFWKTLIGQPVVLIGVSMGGAVAIDYTLTYPEAVQKLVLINSAGFSSGPALGKYLFPPLGYLATKFLQSPRVRQRISQTAYHDPSFATLDAQLCAALHLKSPGWREAMIAFTRSGGYPSFKEKLTHIQQQTLVLWGESDQILGTRDAEAFQNAIPHSQLIWIKHCGHVPHLEQPQLTAQHVLEFLSN